jgi:hypothetical protein
MKTWYLQRVIAVSVYYFIKLGLRFRGFQGCNEVLGILGSSL